MQYKPQDKAATSVLVLATIVFDWSVTKDIQTSSF